MKKIIAVSAVALSAAIVSSPALAAPPAVGFLWTDANSNGIVDAGELTDNATPTVAVKGFAATTVSAGAYNGSYANLAASATALTTQLTTLQGKISKYQAALSAPATAATAKAVADLKTLGSLQVAYAKYNTATAGSVAQSVAASEYAALVGVSKFNDTVLQTALTTNGVGFVPGSGFTANATQGVTAQQTALLGQVGADTAYTTVLSGAGISGSSLSGDATLFVAALKGVETTLKADQDTASIYQSQLKAYDRSTTVLAAGAASKSAYVKNAAAALSSPTAGVNYETEVLGALADHDQRIVSLEALTSEHTRQIADLNGRVDRLDEKVASSTATAIAMGGGAFLPDMKFNLSGNIATYDGAQAIAASIGYRVSNNVALTASIGGGLNKGGKVGGRVGFIFGW